MKRQVIAVDIDDVLSSSAAEWVEFSNRQWGTRLTVDDYSEDWARIWQLEHEDMEARAREIHQSGLYGKFKSFEYAYEVLKELSKAYDLVIATSRVQHIQEQTISWLEKHFKDLFKEVHTTGFFDDLKQRGLHRTKANLIKEIGADYLIDDQLKHCLAVSDAGMETILFGDYPWNKMDELPERVTRCANWREIGDYFAARS
jgi:5'(3')-deoxyribonucleotidase